MPWSMVKEVVKGQEIRIMIDTGASSLNVCSRLITKLNLTPAHKKIDALNKFLAQ